MSGLPVAIHAFNIARPGLGSTTLVISAGIVDLLTAAMAQQHEIRGGQLPAVPGHAIQPRCPNAWGNHRACPAFPGSSRARDFDCPTRPWHPAAYGNLDRKHQAPSPFERLPTELLIQIGSYLASGPDAISLCSFRLCNRRAARAVHSFFVKAFFSDLVVMRQGSSLHMLDEISRSDFRETVTRVAVDVAVLPTVATRAMAPGYEIKLNWEAYNQHEMIRDGRDMKLLTAALLRFPNLRTVGVQHLGVLRLGLTVCLCTSWGILGSKTLRLTTNLSPHAATVPHLSGRGPADRPPGCGNPQTSFTVAQEPDSRAQEDATLCVRAVIAAVSEAGLRPKTLDVLSGPFGPLSYRVLDMPLRAVLKPAALLDSIRELRLGLQSLHVRHQPTFRWLYSARNLQTLHLDLGSSTDQRMDNLLSVLAPPPHLPPVRLFPWTGLAELSLSRASLDVDRLINAVRHFTPTLQRLELDRITLHHSSAIHALPNPPASRDFFPNFLAVIAPLAAKLASFRFSYIAHSGPKPPVPPTLSPNPGPYPPKGYVFIAPGGHHKTISYSGPRVRRALRGIRHSIVARTLWVPDPDAQWEGEDRWEGSWDTWIRTCKCEDCASMVYIHVRPGDPESYPVEMDLD